MLCYNDVEYPVALGYAPANDNTDGKFNIVTTITCVCVIEMVRQLIGIRPLLVFAIEFCQPFVETDPSKRSQPSAWLRMASGHPSLINHWTPPPESSVITIDAHPLTSKITCPPSPLSKRPKDRPGRSPKSKVCSITGSPSTSSSTASLACRERPDCRLSAQSRF